MDPVRDTIANIVLALVILEFIAFPVSIIYLGCAGNSRRRKRRKRG